MFHKKKRLLHHMEQVNQQGTIFSISESIQNSFQRFFKLTSSSPPTPKLSHQDQLSFRIRPFPMSSYNNEQNNMNPCNHRFYHVFKRGELEILIEEASKTLAESKIIKSYYDHGNWCAIVQKDIDSSSL